MEIEVVSNKVFTPVKLTLTFSNEKELGTFFALFNHTPICDVIRKMSTLMPESIRDAIREESCSSFTRVSDVFRIALDNEIRGV